MFGSFKKPKPVVDKKKRLALQKMMCAHYIESIPDDCKKKTIYVLQGDGVWERRVNRLGTFDFRIAKAQIPGLDITMEEGWELSIPRIPIHFLGTTVSFFRSIYKKHRSEVFLQFYYDEEKDEYVMHCPKQTVSGASVDYKNDPEYDSKTLVFEIHSHGNMAAHFSSVDDADEKSDRFYGVIGNLSDFFPDIILRLVVGGREYDVEVEDLFDTDEELYHTENFPKDWVGNIKEKKKKKRKRKNRQGAFTFPSLARIGMYDDEEYDDVMKLFDDRFPGFYSQEVGGHDIEADEDDEDDYGINYDHGVYVKEDGVLWLQKNGVKVGYVENGKYIPVKSTEHRGKKF